MLMILKPQSSTQIIASVFQVTVYDINMHNTTGIPSYLMKHNYMEMNPKDRNFC